MSRKIRQIKRDSVIRTPFAFPGFGREAPGGAFGTRKRGLSLLPCLPLRRRGITARLRIATGWIPGASIQQGQSERREALSQVEDTSAKPPSERRVRCLAPVPGPAPAKVHRVLGRSLNLRDALPQNLASPAKVEERQETKWVSR